MTIDSLEESLFCNKLFKKDSEMPAVIRIKAQHSAYHINPEYDIILHTISNILLFYSATRICSNEK